MQRKRGPFSACASGHDDVGAYGIQSSFGGRDGVILDLHKRLGLRLGSGGGDGLLWHTDLKPHASGDYSIAVVQANSSLEDQGQVFTSPSATYVGVYDGHGGPEASRFVNKNLPWNKVGYLWM
ncbi:probable protein phosphatase 2C 78 [Rosa rugosa]|uniref:probable protein phosphatase 2C 78 n=1 Tax=Rosa rugosa TaxID=74645 RepID=UPI002B40DFF9|nr:probable protein phosphatase 2C 78 [Rosa rugosa]XP_062025459.1 probable protein phosphatase 2C 78 [Rosa rugosa]